MTFENISNGTTCNCLRGCAENVKDTFARRTSESKSLKDRDFKTGYERGKEVLDLKDCSEVCGNKGLSIDLWNTQSKDKLLERYRQTYAISPKLRHHLTIIRFKVGCGKLKNTPVRNQIAGEYHYDFYKCDEFKLELIELVENIPLTAQNV